MLPQEPSTPLPEPPAMPLALAADLQDHLMTATNDLDRLQSLLSGACDTLLQSFHGANAHMAALRPGDAAAPEPVAELQRHLIQAITALQFQDMASQLIAHTHLRLRSCADRLARDTFADDEDGEAIVSDPPLKPNPVTQDEMDAGSIELF